MIKDIYNHNIIIYAFAVLCGLGVLVRLILDVVYIYLVRESDRLGSTNNKLLKHMRMKFETCYKLNIGVNNVDTFVDKSLTKYRFCGILLSTWENLSGQVLLLNFLIVPISAIFGLVFEIGRDHILFTGAVGVLTAAGIIVVDKMTNLPVKKHMIRLNLLDYLENFCKVRLEHELSQPERLEQYRKEYLQVVGERASNIKNDIETKEEINRRKELRKRKEEEKRQKALKREMERKKQEEIRIQEQKRRIEEKKQRVAKRREENLKRLKEENEAIMLRREELLKRAEEKRLHRMKEKQKVEIGDEKISDEIDRIEDKKLLLEGLNEVAAEKEESVSPVLIGNHEQNVLSELSPEEEKLVEDVLREFFA